MSNEDVTNGRDGATKFDGGKLRYSLIPAAPLAELARVYTIGADKYGDYNWMKGMSWGRVTDALQRHLEAWRQGETHDVVDGQHHLSSVIWCAMTLMEYERLGIGMDDRVIDNPVPKLDVQALIAQATQAAMEAALEQLSYADARIEDAYISDAAIDRASVSGAQNTVIRNAHGDVVWQAVDEAFEELDDDPWPDDERYGVWAGGERGVGGMGPDGQTALDSAPEISARAAVA